MKLRRRERKEKKREIYIYICFRTYCSFFTAINFVIIVNLRLRSVGGNELAIGHRYCAKRILVCCKHTCVSEFHKWRVSRALNEKWCLEINYIALINFYTYNRMMIQFRDLVTSAINCYRQLTLDIANVYFTSVVNRQPNVEHSILFMIIIKRNEKRSTGRNCWNCRGTIYTRIRGGLPTIHFIYKKSKRKKKR